MKNLFLTIALMCCVSFAFANEGDKKESTKMKETVEKQVISSESANFRVECFGLSCRTACFDLLADYTYDEYVEMWEDLNWYYCDSRLI